MHCNFIRWAPGSSRSPSSSPPVGHATSLLAPPTQPAPPSVTLVHAGLVPPVHKKCAINGCGQIRIAPDCASQWCRKHCIALYEGFCCSKTHKKPGSAGATAVPLTKAPSAPMVMPSTSVPTTIQVPALLPPTSHSGPSTSSSSADIQPRFSSPLSPAFLEALTRDHELREEKRHQEIKRFENERRAKQTVKVFAWSCNGQEPVVAHIQTGFIWPFFNVSYFVLECVGLVEASDKNCLEYFDDNAYVGYWTRLEVGHIFEVREGHSIFLKSRDVTNCRGSKNILLISGVLLQSSTPSWHARGSMFVTICLPTTLGQFRPPQRRARSARLRPALKSHPRHHHPQPLCHPHLQTSSRALR